MKSGGVNPWGLARSPGPTKGGRQVQNHRPTLHLRMTFPHCMEQRMVGTA